MQERVKVSLAILCAVLGIAFVATLTMWLGGDRSLGRTDSFFFGVLVIAALLIAFGAFWLSFLSVLEKAAAGRAWALLIRTVFFAVMGVLMAVMSLYAIGRGELWGWIILASLAVMGFSWLANRLWGWRL